MEQINIHTAKTQLSKLIAEGKEVIIARYGQPVAKLVPIQPVLKDRVPGTAKGKIKMMDTFFDPLPDDLLHEFYR
ncbi:MAG: type II toxin-antitoxin system Phd/YefM family antitoxin [Syntrophobacteraceae bacterium]|jgi:antitoxin (DNA-binding transcriptional repressor) of toxin-antitoxin stability system|nr:type II toxin-antitoxin system Phd/YefM family antitoxin [Syntrophobacteraceae bacterium]